MSYPEHEEPQYEFEPSSRPEDNDGLQDTDEKAESDTRDHGIKKRKHDNKASKSAKAGKVAQDSNTASSDDSKTRSKMSSKKKPSSSSDSQSPVSFNLVQPLLDETQYISSGIPRPHPIPLIMVSGGDQTMASLRRASAISVRRRYYFLSQGVRINNLIVL